MNFHGKVRFTTQRDCFVNLPKEWIAQLSSNASIPQLALDLVTFRVECANKPLGWSKVVVWSGKSNSSNNSLELSGQFAVLLGLQNGEEVSLEWLSDPPKNCDHVTLVPALQTDWTDITAHGEFIEDNLLRIIRVVSCGSEFPIWLPPTGSKTIQLRVVKFKPNASFVLLCRNTIVEILPVFTDITSRDPARDPAGQNDPIQAVTRQSTLSPWTPTSMNNPFPWTSFVLDMFRRKAPEMEEEKIEKTENFEKKNSRSNSLPGQEEMETCANSAKRSVFLRVQNVWSKNSSEQDIVMTSLTEFRPEISFFDDLIIKASLKILPVSDHQTTESPPSFDVFLRLLGQKSNDFISEKHLGMTESLRRKLNFSNFDIVEVTITESSFQEAEIVSDSVHQAFASSSKSFVETRICPVAFPSLFEQIIARTSLSLSLTNLMANFHPIRSSTFHGLLLCGQFGTGKSILFSEISSALNEFPFLVFSEIIQCKFLRGKRPDTIRKNLEKIFEEAIRKQPTVIFFDDLEFFASNVVTESDAELEYAVRVAQILIDIQDRLQFSKERVLLIASCCSRNLVHRSLADCGTTSVFQTFFEIPVLDWDSRIGILRFFCQEMDLKVEDSCLLSHYADRTSGYILRDFGLLFKRVKHEIVLRENSKKAKKIEEKPSLVFAADFEKAFLVTEPQFKQNISTVSNLSLDANWTDVGGLENVKKNLKKIFDFPIRFPKLYSKCPMRLPRGVLLFGLPGTGKTFVAGVLAKELNIGFIHVRGPEILSKFIGASEAKVRDVFERAKAAKPCLIFFDEFEAIAPRRGHDSTGVTDRVVNQLLTELDGMDSLEGVYVLAATSRPELIDPAILRPGRIDKCIYCALPNSSERLEILIAISRKISLDASVDLENLAKTTEKFSGADLKSVLIDAQFEAVEAGFLDSGEIFDRLNFLNDDVNVSFRRSLVDDPDSLSAEENRKIVEEIRILSRFNEELGSEDPITIPKVVRPIRNEHILKVLHGRFPSVSDEERIHYEKLAEEFQKNGVASFQENRRTAMKVTLA